MASDAQKRATAKFEAKNYDKILLRVKKGDKEKIQEKADQLGMSLNGFIQMAIKEKIERGN